MILEGTRLTLKTELAFALNEHPCIVASRKYRLFIYEQELFRKLVNESILPTLVLDISDGDVGDAADKVADWMTETGGLWRSKNPLEWRTKWKSSKSNTLLFCLF
jgi:hypothetical protein